MLANMKKGITTDVLTRRIKYRKARDPQSSAFHSNKYDPINPNVEAPQQDTSNHGSYTETIEEQCSVVPLAPVSSNWQSPRSIGAGLRNYGNTCFMNSALQCITYTPALHNIINYDGHDSTTCKKPGYCIYCNLVKHIKLSFSKKTVQPQYFAQNLRRINKLFRIGRQEDSHEFLRFFIEGLNESSRLQHGLEKEEEYKTPIFSVLGGFLRSQVKCQKCKHNSNTYDMFMDLALELKGKSLEQCLRDFTKQEKLSRDNQYKCEKCQQLSQATKRFTIHSAPVVLTIQLKRFSFSGFGGMTRRGGKIKKNVQYQHRLNLTRYMSDESVEDSSNFMYNLYGVLVHQGTSSNSGHYYSYVKAPNGNWYQMNDDSVRQVKSNEVLRQNAYMLFYSRDYEPNDLASHNFSAPKKRKLDDVENTENNSTKRRKTEQKAKPNRNRRNKKKKTQQQHYQISQKLHLNKSGLYSGSEGIVYPCVICNIVFS
eukprot:TRINITY_DN9238_c0_g1_i1.p1 TRINITY_DN9238_c0_g1~~TRINITY_DN9238_c0_g1_i1.p1  ORF type:complete len:482 (-),score=72.62 TRINITY_DN9238_c0_g1_i1:435-1880(-)